MALRVLTQNGRKDTIDEPVASHDWDRRLPYMVDHIKNVDPAVITAQELTVHQCSDLMNRFVNWTYAGGVEHGNVPVLWNTKIMHAEEDTLAEWVFPSGRRERYMTLIRLTHIQTGWGAWFGSLHLAAGGDTEPDEATLRARQIRAAVKLTDAWIDDHPYLDDGKPNLIVGGDINDYSQAGGVRKLAYELGGWKPLRPSSSPYPGRLPLSKITGETLRSFNGWHPTSSLPHDGRWHDEIFTSGIALESAALVRTCTDKYQLNASDHNGIRADIAGVTSSA